MYDKNCKLSGIAIIDKSELHKILGHKVYMRKGRNTNYAMLTINHKKVFLHRVICDYHGSLDIDHINGNGLDDRKENLRVVTRSVNIANTNNKLTGISKTNSGKYKARICHNYKSIYIGTFDNLGSAILARENIKQQLFG